MLLANVAGEMSVEGGVFVRWDCKSRFFAELASSGCRNRCRRWSPSLPGVPGLGRRNRLETEENFID